jgi:cell division protein FtsW
MSTRNARDIVVPVLILAGIGLLMVYSSTAFMSTRQYGTSFHYLWNHIFTVCAGVVAMFAISRMDYRKLRPLVIVLMILSLVLVVLVFVPGIGLSANGARRWIRLWPNTFQPSELVKITMVIFLADYMSKNIHRMKNIRYGILIPGGVMLVFQGIILLQPDFGAVMSIGILTMGLLFLGGARLRHLGTCVLLSLPAIYFLISSAPYRKTRFIAFLDPWQDPFKSGFQLVQSLIAFGRGSFSGVGIGGSKQKLFFLPEAHTDFIFSLIGEELGLLGALFVVGLFMWIFIRGVMIARRTADPFSYYLAVGLTMMIACQALVNFSVTTGLMPTKGLPLPFISYGGSALLSSMAAMGILINISRKNLRETRSSCHHPLFIDCAEHESITERRGRIIRSRKQRQ